MEDQWIWLPESLYPDSQKTKFDALEDTSTESFIVAEFKREYRFTKDIEAVYLRFSADTELQLFVNGEIVATGPSAVGGDFLGNGKPREWYYADEVTFRPEGKELCFFARVKMCPTQICQYSKGHGGFMLSARVVFSDKSQESFQTDESWMVRKNGAYFAPKSYDGRISPDGYVNAQAVSDIWQAETASIPVRDEREIFWEIDLEPWQESERDLELDMIYAGFLHLKSEGGKEARLELALKEIDEKGSRESVILKADDEYRGFHLHSAGKIKAHLKNASDEKMKITIGFIATCYPVTSDADTITSDDELNEVLAVCKHSLKYCRQTHHLDSPRHCEPLACTGDYYIEALMKAFSFSDMRLAELDLVRTAKLLCHSGGRMFHTTYSLIWVRMLWDVYMLGGNERLLFDCREALDLLLGRFEGYMGANGLIENPPDYMFVDWIYIDSLSMHHPPKALGQTVLNMFYYMALCYAERIYSKLGDENKEKATFQKKLALQSAVNTLLYDKQKGMYFEGLNTPVETELLNKWQGQNVEKRYYLKHSNILAAYTGICDESTAKDLIHKIMKDEIEGEVQPYFLHYLLEAVYSNGLRDEYTLQIIERWKDAVRECDKGLVEGFVAPEPTYSFDHSHAWAGTPLYSLPKALTGIEILKAGYKKIKLSPSLLGLERAKVEIPTPHGMIVCHMKEGEKAQITVPDGIEAILETE